MQKRIIRKGVLLAGALVANLTLAAQQPAKTKLHVQSSDVAVLFSFEHAQLAQSGTPGFWLKGGSIDGSATFYKGLGIAVNVTGEHVSNIQNNVSLGKLAYMVGPRYTINTSRYTEKLTKKRSTQAFGEWLLGGVHAFDSTFPGTSGVQASANAFSMQLGGGIDVTVKNGFGIRALEVDYVHTTLPNNASNSQNDFRVGFGVSYRR